jgi:hypothetical protein
MIRTSWIRSHASSMPRWSFFARVGNSKTLRELSRWFVFVPILARLLATVARDWARVPNLSFVSHFTLPFDWQLLYYSAFSFMLAGLLYELRAPRIFREYPSYLNFSRSNLEARDLVDFVLEAGRFNGRRQVDKAIVGMLGLADDPRARVELESAATVDAIEQALHSAVFTGQERAMRRAVWHFCNRCRLTSRTVCGMLYLLGFLFLTTAFASDLHEVFRQSKSTGLVTHVKRVVGFAPEDERHGEAGDRPRGGATDAGRAGSGKAVLPVERKPAQDGRPAGVAGRTPAP